MGPTRDGDDDEVEDAVARQRLTSAQSSGAEAGGRDGAGDGYGGGDSGGQGGGVWAWLAVFPLPQFNMPAIFMLAFGIVAAIVLGSQLSSCAARAAAALPAAPPPAGPPNWVEARHGAVAADDARCSAVGRDILVDGGSAADAAVAAALCLGVVRPEGSGLGGGGFILIAPGDGSAPVVIDCRETAPAGAREDMYLGNVSRAQIGGLAVAVPGELRGLWAAHQAYGRLPWTRLVAPAAALAAGFVVDPTLGRSIAAEAGNMDAAMRAVFAPGGAPLRPGQTCSNPAQAAFLLEVAARGPEALYEGRFAADLVAAVRSSGGLLTLEDLKGYAPALRAPLRAAALGLEVLGPPPPSSGGAAILFILEFLSGYAQPLAAAGAGLGAHRLVEAFKHAFALRMALGDPAYWPQTEAVLRDMLSPDFVAALRANTSDASTMPPGAYGRPWNPLQPPPEDHGTTHVSVVDAERTAVALTSTVNGAFGARVMAPASGIVLNNQMDDFSSPGQPNQYGLAPSVANFIRPGKRPLSSMSPTIARELPRADGPQPLRTGPGARGPPPVVRMVAGASGGPRIITAVAQVLLSVLACGRSPQEAVDAPRLHHQLLPDIAWYENITAIDGTRLAVGPGPRAALERRGHALRAFPVEIGVVQAIVHDPESGTLTAVSDHRKGGRPAGY